MTDIQTDMAKIIYNTASWVFSNNNNNNNNRRRRGCRDNLHGAVILVESLREFTRFRVQNSAKICRPTYKANRFRL